MVLSVKEEHILNIPFRICTVESRAEFGLKSAKLHNEDSILPMEENGSNEEDRHKEVTKRLLTTSERPLVSFQVCQAVYFGFKCFGQFIPEIKEIILQTELHNE